MYSGILRWVEAQVKAMRKSQRTTLGHLVAGLMSSGLAGVAAIGRRLPGAALAKHKIKRVDRFLGNGRVDPSQVSEALLRWVCGAGGRLVLAVDWTDLPGGRKMLTAAIPTRGRAMPVLWHVIEAADLGRISQNLLEERFFRELVRLLPKGTEAVVVADRGFGRTSLMKQFRGMGLHFVLRVKGEVIVRHRGQRQKLGEIDLWRNQTIWLRGAEYREKDSTRVNVVLRWHQAMKEPWYLVTDLDEAPREIVSLYAQRMQIEESFRDVKSVRWGFKLRHVRLSSARRWAVLMMIVALAYLFLMAVGIQAEMHRRHRSLMANTSKKRTLSWLTLGRACLREYASSLTRCLRVVHPVFGSV